jgi:hypothetical protein
VNEPELIQGRQIGPEELRVIQEMLAQNPTWTRRKLSIALCEHFDWRSGIGTLRDMSARLLLNKLEERGLIKLPARLHCGGARPPSALRQLQQPGLFDDEAQSAEAIEQALGELQPIQVILVAARSPEEPAFVTHLQRHHYLGYAAASSHSARYLARDKHGRDLACASFGAAAWKVSSRDRFIGWSPDQRGAGLGKIVNNTRFLILPHVRVPHLASHLLGLFLRRLPLDWKAKYGFKPVLAETFVERERFSGLCYRAANWICVGQTVARGRNDRFNKVRVPVKDVLLYPLHPRFKEALCA